MERASAFYQARGFDQFAETYLCNARLCYLRWGADAKVRELDRLHSQIAEPQSAATRMTSIDTPVERLDLATVIKVSQAVSGEIVSAISSRRCCGSRSSMPAPSGAC
jgi:hypothetical protein